MIWHMIGTIVVVGLAFSVINSWVVERSHGNRYQRDLAQTHMQKLPIDMTALSKQREQAIDNVYCLL